MIHCIALMGARKCEGRNHRSCNSNRQKLLLQISTRFLPPSSSTFWIKPKVAKKITDSLLLGKQFRNTVGCWKIWQWVVSRSKLHAAPQCQLLPDLNLSLWCHATRNYLLYFRVGHHACGACAAMWGRSSCPIVTRSWLGFCCVWGNRQMEAARLCHWPEFWGKNKQKSKLW